MDALMLELILVIRNEQPLSDSIKAQLLIWLKNGIVDEYNPLQQQQIAFYTSNIIHANFCIFESASESVMIM